MGAGATTHFTNPLGTAGRVFSYRKHQRMPNPISYTRLRTPVSYNLHLLDGITLTEHGTPIIRPYRGPLPEHMTGFNELMSRKPAARTHATNECAHFFLDDYQFERCWNRPELYPPILGECAMTLTPDYSLYTDMPEPVQRWNVYRSRLLGAYWQHLGLNVIPTLQYSTPDSYQYAFDGIPHHSTIATSTVGVLQNHDARNLWRQGMRTAIGLLEPETILVYGKPMPDHEYPNGITVKHYAQTSTTRIKANTQ